MDYALTIQEVCNGKQQAGRIWKFVTPELFQTWMMETFVHQLCESFPSSDPEHVCVLHNVGNEMDNNQNKYTTSLAFLSDGLSEWACVCVCS